MSYIVARLIEASVMAQAGNAQTNPNVARRDRISALLRERVAAGDEVARAVDALDAVLLEEDNCDNCDPGELCTTHDHLEGAAWLDLRSAARRHAAAVKACEESSGEER